MLKKYSLRKIAAALDRSVSTISDELRINGVKRTYDPRKAHHKAYVRRKYSKYQGMKIVENRKLRKFVENLLYDDQSPAAVSKRIVKREKRLTPVSKNSIYRFIRSVYGRRIESHRQKRKRLQRRRRGKRIKTLDGRIFIDQRPLSSHKRSHIGHAEADFIVSGKSGKGILLVVVDRKSRASFLERITNVTIANVHRAFLLIRERFLEMKTITTDNDILFQRHKELEGLLGVKIYFCHPYRAWEKGTVENTNQRIRTDIPKGSDISKYPPRFICSLEAKLNRRIMDCLDSLTPMEVLAKSRKQKKRRSAAMTNKN